MYVHHMRKKSIYLQWLCQGNSYSGLFYIVQISIYVYESNFVNGKNGKQFTHTCSDMEQRLIKQHAHMHTAHLQ